MEGRPQGERSDDTAPGSSERASWCESDSVSLRQELLINRLLDWAEEARGQGRLKRADYLLSLAWEAYDSPRRS